MVEPRADMFPDESPNDPEGREPLNPTPPAPAQPGEVPAPQPVIPSPQPPKEPVVPLAALHEEREKRKAAESAAEAARQEVERLRAAPPPVTPDEDLTPTERELRDKVYRLEQERETERLLAEFPELKEKAAEFETFRKDYAGFDQHKVAKLFLAESQPAPRRKGLEKPTGGQRQPQSPGMSLEDIDRIRTTNPRLYSKLAQEGKIGNEPYTLG